MMPTTQEILFQIVKASELHPEWTVSEIAHHLGYPAMYTINALDEGERLGWLTRNIKKDTLKCKKLDVYQVEEPYGAEVQRVANEIVECVQNRNLKDDDMEETLVYHWLNGVRTLMVELAIDHVVEINRLARYELADPLDKESVYRFLTKPMNLGRELGMKQFKKKAAKKKAKKSKS